MNNASISNRFPAQGTIGLFYWTPIFFIGMTAGMALLISEKLSADQKWRYILFNIPLIPISLIDFGIRALGPQADCEGRFGNNCPESPGSGRSLP